MIEQALDFRIAFLTRKLECDFYLTATDRRKIENEIVDLVKKRELLRNIINQRAHMF